MTRKGLHPKKSCRPQWLPSKNRIQWDYYKKFLPCSYINGIRNNTRCGPEDRAIQNAKDQIYSNFLKFWYIMRLKSYI